MKLLHIKPVYAHCDLPCGVYDPAQAKIEATSVYAIMTKYNELDEQDKIRAIVIKEERAELTKHHLMVLWADYFKPEHLSKYPDLHDKFWQAIKQASLCKRKLDPAEGQKLIDLIDEIAKIFWDTKKAKLIIRRVVGSSMSPNLAPGQIILATGWFGEAKAGQVFIFNHEGKEKIKRVERIEDSKVFFIGDNLEASSDSRHFGWVRVEELSAHVIWPRVSRS